MTVVLKQDHVWESPKGLVKAQVAGPQPQSFNLVGLGWGLRICISIQLPGDANAVSWEPYF